MDMERRVAVCFLIVVVINPTLTEIIKKYFKNGGEISLTPKPVSKPITEILWKHRGNLVVDWREGSPETDFYPKYQGRAKLDTSTGKLDMKNLAENYTGNYEVQINLEAQTDIYEAVMIKEVPEPEVNLQPLACGSHFNNCSVRCDGVIIGAEPVTYYWKMGDEDWAMSEQVKTIINDGTTQSYKTFTCKVENPISNKESKPLPNPFFKEKEVTPDAPDNGGTIAGSIVGVLLVLVVVAVVVFYFKYRETAMKWIPGRLRGNRTADSENGSRPAKLEEDTPLTSPVNPTPEAGNGSPPPNVEEIPPVNDTVNVADEADSGLPPAKKEFDNPESTPDDR